MPNPPLIRILESASNAKGDLFNRLMGDLFIALGYELPRFNVHKSGRELDIDAIHRLEPRRAIGECKATEERVGGDELNKLIGRIDAEDDGKHPITGYFVSLSGFKETAIEQEKSRRKQKIILLDGAKVVEELITGNALISHDHAAEQAGRCCAGHAGLTLDPQAELLAHKKGWIWAIYYTQGKQRSHFVLIHSDGTPLARQIAEEIVVADQACGGPLHGLENLNPQPALVATPDAALQAYRTYLTNECGNIQLDGLPADGDVGSRRLNLENLFVPLFLNINEDKQTEAREADAQFSFDLSRYSVGDVLSKHSRLAILAAPGGGKSTLLKRLAVAYADPARMNQASDGLPQRDWLPLFFRCRELRHLARGSFGELLAALAQHEPVRAFAAEFLALVNRRLLDGQVLLLVDGLDEIANDGDRAAFVCTLRAALTAYPKMALVVTSREAGFRHVAPHLAPLCDRATLSPFDENDIRRLCVAWHREVVNDSEKVRLEAENLAASIVANDRVKRLATNPLLLTTLLLVKRWVGSLPTRRAVLYGKAIEVLLMTWNTEGHDPLPEEEALPQLCYVASSMMLAGIQKISRPRLAACLREAREALPEELGFVRESVEQFIHRVEERSSLLMMSGHDVEDGKLVEFFEFRHLTFQEYLTAQGMVKGWHLDRKDGDTLAGVLEPHFRDVAWREVIPLAAVQGGRESDGLMRCLVEKVRALEWSQITLSEPELRLLATCLADEIPARPDTIKSAVGEIVRLGRLIGLISPAGLFEGKYGGELLTEVRRTVLDAPVSESEGARYLLGSYSWNVAAGGSIEQILTMLNSPERITRLAGACGGRVARMWSRENRDLIRKHARDIGSSLTALLDSELLQEQVCASNALEWLGSAQWWPPPDHPDLLGRLFFLWGHGGEKEIRRSACRALISQNLMPREGAGYLASNPQGAIDACLERYEQLTDDEKCMALIVAWYTRRFDDQRLVKEASVLRAGQKNSFRSGLRTLRELLDYLGEKPNS